MLIFQIFIAKGFEGDGSNKKTHSQKDTHLFRFSATKIVLILEVLFLKIYNNSFLQGLE